jgi:glutathione-regulated potassium-efflux system ancillary protein KefG
MPSRILILFAHPAFHKSRAHRWLVHAVRDLPGVTLHDLYEAYPDYDVDVPREQSLLAEHDTIVLQHPFYWYSTPPLVKQWEDLVLEHGWAYGSHGTALRGKRAMSAITAGGGEAAYSREGRNRYTIRELLAPIEQTWRLCGVEWLPPFVVHGTHATDEAGFRAHGDDYRRVIEGLRDGTLDLDAARDWPRINHALPRPAKT